MSAKRPRDEDAGPGTGGSSAPDDARRPKKAKHGFRVGPDNLPDGAWRRKVTKIKKDLITKAKVKKQYAKIKAEHQKQAAPTLPTEGDEPTGHQNDHDQPAEAQAQIHPERQAMLDDPSSHPNQQQQAPGDADPDGKPSSPQRRQERRPRNPRKQQRPDYYTKELAAAEQAKQQAEERAAEFARREQERQQRIAERERYQKAMAKAKAPGRDGKPKVGKEGRVLLKRVMKIMGPK
ncbi:hypothetical protein C8A00DRAFT_30583 [Chaetomidium leptoderma]|uniref:rRNA-processing protein FYV7 n=1 Tax=Chaetomidium leptoderma TaxID=669021 RepID=A0AAN6VUL2_9PEZI|nr:hypothetical protein C8A00DRAFT_30583 [Chaetomidium leptoderma]